MLVSMGEAVYVTLNSTVRITIDFLSLVMARIYQIIISKAGGVQL